MAFVLVPMPGNSPAYAGAQPIRMCSWDGGQIHHALAEADTRNVSFRICTPAAAT